MRRGRGEGTLPYACTRARGREGEWERGGENFLPLTRACTRVRGDEREERGSKIERERESLFSLFSATEFFPSRERARERERRGREREKEGERGAREREEEKRVREEST